MARAQRGILEREDIRLKIKECAEVGLSNADIARYVGSTVLDDWYDAGMADVARGNRTTKHARLYLLISTNRAAHYKKEFENAKRQSANGNDRATKLLIEQSSEYRHEQKIHVRITEERLKLMSTEELIALKNGDQSPLVRVERLPDSGG